jgi:hypothetical protein
MVYRFIIAASLLAAVGCTSPEATRTLGGGPGADTGNRRELVRMHEGSRPFYKTPHLAPGERGPVVSAQHARQRSL